MRAKHSIPHASDLADSREETTAVKPEKEKSRPFLDDAQLVESDEFDGIAFNPIPPGDRPFK